MKRSFQIRVKGKVQNVGFRFYTLKTAQQFNIHGFVRNEPDGSVYIEAEGTKIDLETFTDWCRRGPQWARVDQVEIQESPLVGYNDFRIR